MHGISDIYIEEISFDEPTQTAQIEVLIAANVETLVRDEEGSLIEGEVGASIAHVQRWTFQRVITADDPNWILIAT